MLAADKVFLNVGTHAATPNVPGLDAGRPLTHIEALELDYLPPHLVVIGGGYVGLEMAQAYRRFGSDVTIIEPGPRLMGWEDIDVSLEMQRILSEEGIQVILEAELFHVDGQSGDRVDLVVRTASGQKNIDGSNILVAAGRVPNTGGIGLKEAGVELDSRRYIRVNGRLETSAPDVWRSENALAARISRTYPRTIFASFVTIWQEGIAARAIESLHTACSRIPRLPTWG